MTEPLIDRNNLVRAVQSGVPIGSVGHVQPITDAVITYLRSVLTPDGMWDIGMYHSFTTEQLHRRIFGEGK